MDIIIRKSRHSESRFDKDFLHKRRKQLAEEMKDGLFTKDQMNMRDCKDESAEHKRVEDYDKWKDKKINGVSNQDRMNEWASINKRFKAHGGEARLHSMNDIRKGRTMYD